MNARAGSKIGTTAALLMAAAMAFLTVAWLAAPPAAAQANSPLREQAVSAALSQPDLFDCAAYDSSNQPPILPPHRQLLTVESDTESSAGRWPGSTARPSPDLQLPELTDGDRVIVSNSGQQALAALGATPEAPGGDTPAVAVLYNAGGGSLSLLRNCQYSALQAAWSADDRYIAYPVHTEHAEIRVYDVQSGVTSILLRWDRPFKIYNLVWSPDGRFLAFTLGERGQEIIWVATTDGQALQALRAGLLSSWSEDGSYLVYAQRWPGPDPLRWRKSKIRPAQSETAVSVSPLDGGRPTRTYPRLGGDVVGPHSLEQLLDGVTLIVTATVGPVQQYVESFGPDRVSEPISPDAFDSPLAGFPMTDFLLNIEDVVVDDGSIARGEPILLREMGGITEHLKELTATPGGEYEVTWTGDRYFFLLIPDWDGEEKVYFASYRAYGRLIVEGNLLRVSGGDRLPLQFLDSDEPIPFDEFVRFVAER